MLFLGPVIWLGLHLGTGLFLRRGKRHLDLFISMSPSACEGECSVPLWLADVLQLCGVSPASLVTHPLKTNCSSEMREERSGGRLSCPPPDCEDAARSCHQSPPHSSLCGCLPAPTRQSGLPTVWSPAAQRPDYTSCERGYRQAD